MCNHIFYDFITQELFEDILPEKEVFPLCTTVHLEEINPRQSQEPYSCTCMDIEKSDHMTFY